MNTPIKPKLQRFQTATAFACPICQLGLELVGTSFKCPKSHSFDLAKFGYVNAFDLSKESVQLAAKSDASWKVNWFVGDLAHLPIQSKSMEVILDIFSPANYAEFERVLKTEGVIIKVVPTSSHQKEIRQLAQYQLAKQSYSNQEILEHFEDHCQILSSETVSLTKSLTPEERQALLAMTPLLFHVDQEKINWTRLTEITIEAQILVGKLKIQSP